MSLSLRKFIFNYENGKYNKPDFNTMVKAGWFDWFCHESELKPKLDALFPLVKLVAQSKKS